MLFHDIKTATAKALPESCASSKRAGLPCCASRDQGASGAVAGLMNEYAPRIAKAALSGGKTTKLLPFYGALGPSKENVLGASRFPPKPRRRARVRALKAAMTVRNRARADGPPSNYRKTRERGQPPAAHARCKCPAPGYTAPAPSLHPQCSPARSSRGRALGRDLGLDHRREAGRRQGHHANRAQGYFGALTVVRRLRKISCGQSRRTCALRGQGPGTRPGQPASVNGAVERTRTFTPFPALPPQGSASTNSATTAFGPPYSEGREASGGQAKAPRMREVAPGNRGLGATQAAVLPLSPELGMNAAERPP